MTKNRRAFKGSLLVVLLGLLLAACQGAPTSTLEAEATVRAQPTESFVDSIGVNVHVNYTDTIYGNFAGRVKPSLQYLGVRHIRDGIPFGASQGYVTDRYRELSNIGIRLTGAVPYVTTDMPTLIGLIKVQRDSLEAVEGPNETDQFKQFSYKGQTFPNGTIAFMKDFYPAVKNDPVLRNIPVLQTTLALPENKMPDGSSGNNPRATLLGDLSRYTDYGNSHNYFAFGQEPGSGIVKNHLPYISMISLGKPKMSTEGGYRMGSWDGNKGGWEDGLSAPFDEYVQGRYLTRYLLEMYRLGYKRSFIYELLDMNSEQWGLFRTDGRAKPAAYGIRNMLQLLNEGRWDSASKRWVSPSFTPGTLNYTLPTLPSSVHSLLFQKSNGKFYLLLWNDVKNWDAATAKRVYTNPVAARLQINQAVSSVRTFLPLTNGVTATATMNSSTVNLSIPDHPLIVEITLR